MSKCFAVVGAGMQGTAAAYDLVRFANPCAVLMGDACERQANASASRVNELTNSELCQPKKVNAMDAFELAGFVEAADVVLSCVPYWMHPAIEEVCAANGKSVVDLGGNTEITMKTLALDGLAKKQGATIVPDTGLAPGLVNSIGLAILERLENVESVKLYCGVLPQHPKPPLNYKLTFNVEGLVTEYDFQAVVLRDGEIEKVDTLDELEELEFDQLGKMEAFTTSGGTSTAPYSFRGRAKNYEYKTVRHRGHCSMIRVFRDFGFWSEEEIEVGEAMVRPRHVFYKVFGDALSQFEDDDLCVVRGVGIGTKNGAPTRLLFDIFDKQDPKTGFTSMERLTGFSMSIYAIHVANGGVPPGAVRYEHAMGGQAFLDEIVKRGIELTVKEERIGACTDPALIELPSEV